MWNELRASFLNGRIGVHTCWLPCLLWIGISKTAPLASHTLALTPALAISAALSFALAAT